MLSWLCSIILPHKAREAKKELKELLFQNTPGRIKNTDVPLQGPWLEPPAQILKQFSESKSGGCECQHINWPFLFIPRPKPSEQSSETKLRCHFFMKSFCDLCTPHPTHTTGQERPLLTPMPPCFPLTAHPSTSGLWVCGSPPSQAWWPNGRSLPQNRHLKMTHTYINDEIFRACIYRKT